MKYQIEGDYYIIVEPCDYAVAKYKGKDKNGKEIWDFMTYHAKPEEALQSYCRSRVHDRLYEANAGTLTDMVKIMSDECKRLSDVVKTAFKAIAVEL